MSCLLQKHLSIYMQRTANIYQIHFIILVWPHLTCLFILSVKTKLHCASTQIKSGNFNLQSNLLRLKDPINFPFVNTNFLLYEGYT